MSVSDYTYCTYLSIQNHVKNFYVKRSKKRKRVERGPAVTLIAKEVCSSPDWVLLVEPCLPFWKNLGSLRILPNIYQAFLVETNTWMMEHLFTTWFAGSNLETYFLKRKISFKVYCLVSMGLFIQGLWWRFTMRLMLFLFS